MSGNAKEKEKHNDSVDCFFLLDRWKEALDLKSEKYQTPLLGLIEHLPECVPILFDRCITHSHDDRKHKDFHVNKSNEISIHCFRSLLVTL